MVRLNEVHVESRKGMLNEKGKGSERGGVFDHALGLPWCKWVAKEDDCKKCTNIFIPWKRGRRWQDGGEMIQRMHSYKVDNTLVPKV
jgi:hypothetical protein